MWDDGRWGFYVFALRQPDDAQAGAQLAIFAVEVHRLTLEPVTIVASDSDLAVVMAEILHRR